MPLLVIVLAGNVVTAAMVAACLNTIDANALRRLHPAIAAAVAEVPWADTTTLVWDLTRWHAALPAAVGLNSGSFDDDDIARLPPTLRSLDVSYCRRVTRNVSFAHLHALASLDCTRTSVGMTGVVCMPPSLRELRMKYCELHKAADFSHLRGLRVLDCSGNTLRMISAATIASLPPSLEVLGIGGINADTKWPLGGSLVHLTRLRVLRVASTCIVAAALATFPPSLHSLDLNTCRLTKSASFAHLHGLHTLNANSSNIGDAVLATLPPSLVSLDLQDGRKLTPAAVFPQLPALRVLNMSDTAIGDAAVASMPPSLPDGRLVSCTHRGRVALWAAVHGGAQLAGTQIKGQMNSCHLAVLPDGHRVAIAVRDSKPASNRIVVWDTRDALQAARGVVDFRDDVATSALTALPNGHLAVGFAPNGALRIVDVDAGAVLATLVGHSKTVAALAALPGGRLASGSSDKTVRLWDVEAGVCVATLVGHTCHIQSLAVLWDGRLASGSSDGTVRLWDVGIRTCVGVLQGITSALLIVLPGSDRLASVSCDDTLQVWDTQDAAGEPTATVELAGSDAMTLVPLPGGRLATSGSGVRLWQLPLEAQASQ